MTTSAITLAGLASGEPLDVCLGSSRTRLVGGREMELWLEVKL